MLLAALLLCAPVAKAEPLSLERQSQVVNACVRIIDHSAGAGGQGSGVMVGADEQHLFVLTAHHVIDAAVELEVHCFDAHDKRKVAERIVDGIEIVAQSKSADLALLRVKSRFRPKCFLTVCSSEWNPHPRDSVFSVGCTGGEVPTCSSEKMVGSSFRRREHTRAEFFVTDGKPAGGRSGGPLVDSEGRLVGICRGVLAAKVPSHSEGLYASLSEIQNFLGLAKKEHKTGNATF